MDLLKLYFEILRDPAIPFNRVVRKTAFLIVFLLIVLVYYRHIHLQFGFYEPLLVTLGLGFVTFGVVGVFGGISAGYLYESFLKDVKATKTELTLTVFVVEWLFAISAPLFGALLYVSIGSRIN